MPIKLRMSLNTKASDGMFRREMILGMAAVGLAACSPGGNRPIGADGLPLPSVYRISSGDTATVQLFSALKRTGLDEARQQLDAFLSAQPDD